MSLDAIAVLGIVLAIALVAFAVSAAIGLLIGRLGLVEAEDIGAMPPEPHGAAVDIRPVTRSARTDETA